MSVTTTMEFKRGATTITVNTPLYGYTSETQLAIWRTPQCADGSYKWYDNGAAYDVRLFTCSIQYPTDQQKSIQDFFRETTQGRGNRVQLKVPAGIFPFGPDLGGGVRRFKVRLVNAVWGSVTISPWMCFESELTFALDQAPTYTVPGHINATKNLQIGPIDDIRTPPNSFQIEAQYMVNTLVTYGGASHPLDRSNAGDRWTSQFVVVENERKTAGLREYMRSTARGSNFTIIAQANSYLFGRDHAAAFGNVGGGTYTVTTLTDTIRTRHESFKRWATEFHVAYVSHTGL